MSSWAGPAGLHATAKTTNIDYPPSIWMKLAGCFLLLLCLPASIQGVSDRAEGSRGGGRFRERVYTRGISISSMTTSHTVHLATKNRSPGHGSRWLRIWTFNNGRIVPEYHGSNVTFGDNVKTDNDDLDPYLIMTRVVQEQGKLGV